jgi:hypothetical protein
MLIYASDLDLEVYKWPYSKEIFKKNIIIYDNLCAKPNRMTGQKLG